MSARACCPPQCLLSPTISVGTPLQGGSRARQNDAGTMLTIHITAAEATQAADETGTPDGLVASLAQYGVSPAVIQTALAALAQRQSVVLCQPSEADAWELVVPPVSPS
jgi:hypothetical protein